ncbi:MAG TPA: NAD(P)/FAD-dependent oxidoreductase [Actinomycetota bacterium]|nr:NAD(P)/FAD-dependent oxidoreductase [Actinomycetota bacterium]
MSDPDAIVIGAGPNGLVGANYLADEGWDVLVLEAQGTPGGAVRSGPLTEVPGFTHDYFSAFYPLAAASSALAALQLEDYGLRWCRSPLVVAHPMTDGRCAVLSSDLEETVANLETFAAADGESWRRIYGVWHDLEEHLLPILLGPFPPILPVPRLVADLGPSRLVRQLRFWSLPVRRMAEESFRSAEAGLLLAGNALHADLAPEVPGSGFLGVLLCSLGQHHGFPVPEGGAGKMTEAMVKRLRSRGGQVVCGQRVARIDVRKGAAVGVTTQDGTSYRARKAVLADVAAPALYRDLVGSDHLPPQLMEDIAHFQFDNGTVKVDWALDGPVPWKAEEAHRAGTVHITESMDHLTESSAQLAMGLIPAKPYMVFGQMNVADPSRSPVGTETAWAYTHVPQEIKGDAGGRLTGRWDDAETAEYVDRMESEVEKLAPGFRDRIIGRFVRTPPLFEEADENLVRGALGGGTAQLHQQMVFRPTPGLGGARTPVKHLYLASASAHPGGGVHGAPGAIAAQTAVRDRKLRQWLPVAAAGAAGLALSRKRTRR